MMPLNGSPDWPNIDGLCYYCGERTDSLAGDPSRWPLTFTQPDGSGITHAHHIGCVQERLCEADSRRASLVSPPKKRWFDIPGWMDFQDLYESIVVQSPSPAIFVEVGSFLGRSTAYLGARIRESGKSIALHAVDTWAGSGGADPEGDKVLAVLTEEERADLAGAFRSNMEACGLDVTMHQCTSIEAAALFPDRSLGLVFLDGAHDYASVRADIAVWLPKLAPSGCLSGHDYKTRESVRQAVDEVFGQYVGKCGNSWMVIMSED